MNTPNFIEGYGWNETTSPTLVEELGGYDCAKAAYEDPMHENGEFHKIKATDANFFKHNLEEEPLKYRQKQNIFQIGDYVVAIKHPYDRVERILKIDEDGFFYSETGLYCNPFLMRHATKKEIDVGFRLDD